jgi:hypothetical protein
MCGAVQVDFVSTIMSVNVEVSMGTELLVYVVVGI